MYISYIFGSNLICLETVRQDLAAENNSVYDGSELPKFSAKFAEVLKEILESKVKGET